MPPRIQISIITLALAALLAPWTAAAEDDALSAADLAHLAVLEEQVDARFQQLLVPRIEADGERAVRNLITASNGLPTDCHFITPSLYRCTPIDASSGTVPAKLETS
jgi:hypothetical protein